MALFEYRCCDCGYTFEALVQTSEEKPACPACGSANIEKLLSTFAVSMKSGPAGNTPPSCPGGGCCGGGCGMG
jgi:putative FmdB family regulatory protein